MDTLIHDLRYGLRKLRHAPGFAAIAVGTLALAIGATTAMFSVVNGVLLNALPFAEPDRLVYIQSTSPDDKPMPASPQDLSDYRAQSHSFIDIVAVDAGETMSLMRNGAPAALRVSGARVGANFFTLLGVRPAFGRGFLPGDDTREAARVVVLSDQGWHRYFGGDPHAVGRSVTINGDPYRIVGIAPPSLTFPQSSDLLIPAVWKSFEIGEAARGYHSVTAVGRLAPGATVAGAQRDLSTIAARLSDEYPRFNAQIGARVDRLDETLLANVRRPLWAMLGAVGFVLLIACANVANLLLVRAAGRQSELAVRTALGAGRGRVVRQLVAESMLLAGAGAVIGAVLAAWLVAAIVALHPAGVPRLPEISIDARVLGTTAAIAILTGLIFGLVPALSVARPNVAQVLRDRSRGTSGRMGRLRSTLIVSQLALAMVLLVGAGLLARSFIRLMRVDPGFRPEHLIVFDVALSGNAYQIDRQVIDYTAAVARRVRALPGVTGVAVAAVRPIDPDPNFSASSSFTVDGEPKPELGREPVGEIIPVSPSFFDVMGTPFVRGRSFTEAENRIDVPPVLVVNESLARRYFPNQNPIGKHITFGFSHTTTASDADSVRVRGEIVGIVADEKRRTLSETPSPAAYVPFNTAPFAASFAVRAHTNPAALERAIGAQVRGVDPTQPMYELSTMTQVLSSSVAQPRFYLVLLGGFAAIALLLAGLGIYGVVSYTVGQRTREFGIRIALGATAAQVVRLVVRRGIALAVAGLAIGTIGAVAVTRSIQSLLFDTQPADPLTFAAVALVLMGAAIAAAWLPARRAARVDPVVTMRAE